MRKAVGVIAAAMALSATGCTGSADRSGPFPARPYSINVAEVDPCSAFSDEQRAEFNLRSGSAGVAQGGTSQACTWPSNDGVGYSFQTLAVDAQAAIGAEPTSVIVTVAGFGAVQSSPPAEGTGLPFCQVVLDVADDASLRAQLQISPRGAETGRYTVDNTCEQVRRVAALMLDNLHAQQTG